MQVTGTYYDKYATVISGNASAKAQEADARERDVKETQDADEKTLLEELKEQMEEQERQFLASLANMKKENEDVCQFSFYKTDKGSFELRTTKPKDNSSNLTRRLVSAAGQMEVRQVMSEAMSDMVKLRMVAAIGSKEDQATARAAIKRLEKLMGRAQRKIRDLDSEDVQKVRRAKAEKNRQQKRADQIKEELRKQQIIRHARENSYLLEGIHDQILGLNPYSKTSQNDPNAKLDAASEAWITAQAEAMAAVESVADTGGGEVCIDTGGETAVGGEGGTVSLEGGEASAEGGVDIAV